MARYDNGYSRLVAWGKIILPLVALGLLSSIFLLSRDVDPTQSIPFAELEVDTLAREQRITAPVYAGMTKDGGAVYVSAETARPAPENRDIMIASQIHAALEAEGGSKTQLSARDATINTAAGTLEMTGGVVITTSTGYRITTQGIQARLDRIEIESMGPIKGKAPSGQLTAGQMRIAPREGEPTGPVLLFKNGVKLIYTPR